MEHGEVDGKRENECDFTVGEVARRADLGSSSTRSQMSI